MKLVELYKQTPVARHPEIIVSGERVFFDGEEYILQGDGELKLVRDEKALTTQIASLKADLAAIKTKLGVK